jgi:hypothetical protein
MRTKGRVTFFTRTGPLFLQGEEYDAKQTTCLMSYHGSVPIGIDTLSTYFMTNNKDDFTGKPSK